MRGYELTAAREQLRRELRRAAIEDLPPGLALDLEHLFDLVAGGATQNRGILLQRTLVVRGLRAGGFGADDIARGFHMTPAEVTRELERPILEDGAVTVAIHDKVREALPETPEPGRAVAPTGEYAVPGMPYPPDPRLVGEGR